MAFYVYILASQKNGTLYVGSTDNLTVRISQHKQHLRPGFTSKYRVDLLVWYEVHDTREGAFRRERRIKEWNRAWKVRLIEKRNLAWRDLYDEFLGGGLGEPLFTPLIASPGCCTSFENSGSQPLPPPLIPAKAGTQDRSEPDPQQ